MFATGIIKRMNDEAIAPEAAREAYQKRKSERVIDEVRERIGAINTVLLNRWGNEELCFPLDDLGSVPEVHQSVAARFEAAGWMIVRTDAGYRFDIK